MVWVANLECLRVPSGPTLKTIRGIEMNMQIQLIIEWSLIYKKKKSVISKIMKHN